MRLTGNTNVIFLHVVKIVPIVRPLEQITTELEKSDRTVGAQK